MRFYRGPLTLSAGNTNFRHGETAQERRMTNIHKSRLDMTLACELKKHVSCGKASHSWCKCPCHSPKEIGDASV